MLEAAHSTRASSRANLEVEHEIRDQIGLVYTQPEMVVVCEAIAHTSSAPLDAACEIVGLVHGESATISKKQEVATVLKAAKLLRDAGKVRPLTAL